MSFESLLLQLRAQHELEVRELESQVLKLSEENAACVARIAEAQSSLPAEGELLQARPLEGKHVAVEEPLLDTQMPGTVPTGEVTEDEVKPFTTSLPEGGRTTVGKAISTFAFTSDSVLLQSAFVRWLTFTRQCNSHMQFHVKSSWTNDVERQTHMARMRHSQGKTDILASEEEGQVVRSDGCGKLMLVPMGRSRVTWELWGALMLCYDAIVIPLNLFDMEANIVLTTIDTFVLVYWTIDIALSFMSGYIEKGKVVMDPRRVAWHYITTWFLFDTAIVGVDWVMFVLSAAQPGKENLGKFLRATRIGRSVRMVRLAKLSRVMTVIKDHIDSEGLFIVFSMLKPLGLLLAAAHFTAAIWFEAGTIMVEAGHRSWVEQMDGYSPALEYRYLTALHWALCTFTVGTMDVYPCNWLERIISVVILTLGVIVFSTFISTITTSMAQIAKLSEADSAQLWLLRKYLSQNSVNRVLMFRVLKYVEFACKAQKETIQDTQVHVLGMLSDQLQAELRCAVTLACLSKHPLFMRLAEFTEAMNQVAMHSVEEHSLALGDTLFAAGTDAKHAICIRSGSVFYNKVDSEELGSLEARRAASREDWLCEAALWTTWSHLGEAYASQASRLIYIEVKAFPEAISEELAAWQLCCRYAAAYVASLHSTRRAELSDALMLTASQIEVLETYCVEEASKDVGAESIVPGYMTSTLSSSGSQASGRKSLMGSRFSTRKSLVERKSVLNSR